MSNIGFFCLSQPSGNVLVMAPWPLWQVHIDALHKMYSCFLSMCRNLTPPHADSEEP